MRIVRWLWTAALAASLALWAWGAVRPGTVRLGRAPAAGGGGCTYTLAADGGWVGLGRLWQASSPTTQRALRVARRDAIGLLGWQRDTVVDAARSDGPTLSVWTTYRFGVRSFALASGLPVILLWCAWWWSERSRRAAARGFPVAAVAAAATREPGG
ncbi:MAG TPA: hypothetical protein VER17_19365 [Tepidisphaeraceae bacterium]|nr:hypothetical protein [Tepidisphaeraceae bacterium]